MRIESAVVDADGDGMTDEFEMEYFNHPTAGDPALDSDSDGAVNLAEHTAGTNPIDAGSVFRIDEIRRQGNDLVIVFQAAPDRSYRLEEGPTLASYPNIVQNIPPTPTGGTRTIILPGAATGSPRFYRAAVSFFP